MSGAITVDAGQAAESFASSTLSRLSVSVGISAGVLVSSATIGGSLTASMDGDASGGSLTVTAIGTNHTNAVTNMVGGGTLAFTGAGALAEIQSGADITAAVGSSASIDVAGAISVTAQSTNTSFADSRAASGGLGTGTVELPTALVGGATRSTFDGDTTTAGSIDIETTSTNTATATPIALSVGGITAAGTEADAEVTGNADTEALVGSTASIGATGAITVKANAHNNATSSVTSASLGAITIQIMLPVAKVDAGTKARLDGSVTGSGGVTTEAVAENHATATTEIISISIGGAAGAVARASVGGDVEAGIGSGTIASSGEIKVWAHLQGAQNNATATANIKSARSSRASRSPAPSRRSLGP